MNSKTILLILCTLVMIAAFLIYERNRKTMPREIFDKAIAGRFSTEAMKDQAREMVESWDVYAEHKSYLDESLGRLHDSAYAEAIGKDPDLDHIGQDSMAYFRILFTKMEGQARSDSKPMLADFIETYRLSRSRKED